MSVTSNSRLPPLGRTVLAFLNDCANAVALHFIRRAAIACLSERDDRELRDIGIVRSEIRAAVHGFMNLPGPGKDAMMPSPALQVESHSANGHAPARSAILETTT